MYTNYQKIDKLSALIESCVENIQFTVMCEADGASVKDKVKAFGKKAVDALKYVWRLLADSLRSAVIKIKNLGRNESVLTKDLSVSKYVFVGLPTGINSLFTKLLSASKTYGANGNAKNMDDAKDKIDAIIDELDVVLENAKASKAIILKANTKVRIDSLAKTADGVRAIINVADKAINAGQDYGFYAKDAIDAFNRVGVYLSTIVKDIEAVLDSVEPAKAEKVEKVKAKAVTESTSVLKMRLLTEAIKCLNEAEEVETVSVATDAEKPEVAYEEVASVTEEKEDVDTPYCPEASGGACVGEKEDPVLDDTAITDLLEDHEDALKILKDEDEEESALVESEPEVAKDTEATPAAADVENSNELLESIYSLNW